MSSLRILVVDDFDDARELLGMIFSDAGFTVISAANGSDAVALARQRLPDVIVMDVTMPEMDGLEATRRIKADPILSHVPVVAYTAKTSPAKQLRSLFDAVCKKPCAPDTLLALVRRCIRPSLPRPRDEHG